jgi:hypothetical protein
MAEAMNVRDVVQRMKEKYPLPSLDHNWQQLKDDPTFLDTIFEAVASGHSVAGFTEAVGLSGTKVSAWLSRLEGENAARYEAARAARAGLMADRILEVLEKVRAGTVLGSQARVEIDSLKWLAERLDPHLWGNKIHIRADIKTTTEYHLEAVRELAEMVKGGGDIKPIIEGEVEPKLMPYPVEMTPEPKSDRGENRSAPVEIKPKKEKRKTRTDQALQDLLS